MWPNQREQLTRWLATHRHAWAGWPTSRAFDDAERADRIARLAAHGCPYTDFPSLVDDVHDIVGELRGKHRDRYARMVRKSSWEAFA